MNQQQVQAAAAVVARLEPNCSLNRELDRYNLPLDFVNRRTIDLFDAITQENVSEYQIKQLLFSFPVAKKVILSYAGNLSLLAHAISLRLDPNIIDLMISFLDLEDLLNLTTTGANILCLILIRARLWPSMLVNYESLIERYVCFKDEKYKNQLPFILYIRGKDYYTLKDSILRMLVPSARIINISWNMVFHEFAINSLVENNLKFLLDRGLKPDRKDIMRFVHESIRSGDHDDQMQGKVSLLLKYFPRQLLMSEQEDEPWEQTSLDDLPSQTSASPYSIGSLEYVVYHGYYRVALTLIVEMANVESLDFEMEFFPEKPGLLPFIQSLVRSGYSKVACIPPVLHDMSDSNDHHGPSEAALTHAWVQRWMNHPKSLFFYSFVKLKQTYPHLQLRELIKSVGCFSRFQDMIHSEYK